MQRNASGGSNAGVRRDLAAAARSGGLSRRRFLAGAAATGVVGGLGVGRGRALAGPSQLSPHPWRAASAQGEPIEELVIALGEDTRLMDPDIDQGLNDMYRLIFNTLAKLDSNMAFVPDLASEWEVVDDTTIVFTLRQDVTWHDGAPFTADDVVFTWTRMSDPDRESTNFPRFEPWLGEVTALDQFTVQFTTKFAHAPALEAIAEGFWIAPRHDIEARGDDEFGQLPIGTGPYRIDEWQRDQALRLSAVDGWWGGAQPFPRVRFVIIPEPFTRVTAMLGGDVHIVSEPPVAMLEQIEGSGQAYITQAPGDRIQFIQFPHVSTRHPDTPEIDNKLVRQALNYALDRRAIVENVGRGYFEVVPGPWSPGNWGYPANAEELGYSYDPERARQLLAEAGYGDGFTFHLGTSVGFSLMDKELMEACVPYYQDIGLEVDFVPLEWSAFDPARDENKFSAYYLGLTGGASDPDGVITFYMTARGRTRGFYGTDPELDEVILAGPTIVDPEERRTYYQETVFPKVLDVAPWVFLWSPYNLFAVDNRLEYQATSFGHIDAMEVSLRGA